jgi:hypothetical protein
MSYWISCYLGIGFLWACFNTFSRQGQKYINSVVRKGEPKYDFVTLVGFIAGMLLWPLWIVLTVYLLAQKKK